MKRIYFLFLFFCILFLFANAGAALTDNGDGTVTDADTGLMWLQSADNGAMEWYNADAWVDELIFASYDDWRLPDLGECRSNCDNNKGELRHLYYIEGISTDTPGPFSGVNGWYWGQDNPDGAGAWAFRMDSGSQGSLNIFYTLGVWAVRDIPPVVPEPVSSTLFLIGGGFLAARRKFKK